MNFTGCKYERKTKVSLKDGNTANSDDFMHHVLVVIHTIIIFFFPTGVKLQLCGNFYVFANLRVVFCESK